MNAFTPLQNLKSFILNGPPLVLFTLTLTICGITALSLAYYIGESVYISDPDLIVDWNTFLDGFASNKLCLTNNHSIKIPPFTSASHVNQSLENVEEVVSFLATFKITWSSAQAMNVSLIHGNMTFQNVNSEGDNYNASVALSFIGEHNLTSCSWEHSLCEVKQTACVSIRGLKSMFPKTRRPSKCAAPQTLSAYNQSWEMFTSKVADDNEVSEINKSSVAGGSWCKYGSPLVIKYQPDSDLTLMLSMHDRSMINLHLMHTSYFLFVMVITVFCFAILRGKNKAMTSDMNKNGFEKVPMKM